LVSLIQEANAEREKTMPRDITLILNRALRAGLAAAALLAGSASLSGCALDNMWSDSARAECDRDNNTGRRMNCNDRVDQIERERDRR